MYPYFRVTQWLSRAEVNSWYEWLKGLGHRAAIIRDSDARYSVWRYGVEAVGNGVTSIYEGGVNSEMIEGAWTVVNKTKGWK